MKKRILFINGNGVGGAEMMTIYYANILYNAGFECKILTRSSSNDGLQYKEIVSNGIQHTEVYCRFRKFPFYVLKEIWKYRPNIVFAWNPIVVKQILNPLRKYHLTPTFRLICRCPNTPSVMDPKECNFLSAFRHADMVIAQTREMEKELVNIIGVDDKKIITIYNPINKDRIQTNIEENYPYDKSYTNFIAAGRISEQKDYATMLKAFVLVLEKRPRSRLYICGKVSDKEISDSLQKIIIDNSLQDSVFFEGFQPNPHKYVKDADVYVLSSIYEGLPNAMIEAMYLGIPVAAATCIPYISEVIHDGVNGYTCPIKSPELLSHAMLKACEIKNLPKFVNINNSETQIVDLFNSI